MKKLTIAVLVLLVALCSVYAGGADESAAVVTKTTTTRTSQPKAEPEYKTDFELNSVYAGEISPVFGSSEGGEVSYDYYKGTAGKDYTDPAFYTYNDYTSGTSNMKWSTHTWETSSDSAILDYISRGFYGFELNDTLDGWAITCEMAVELPIDVTSEYVGKYGIKEGETAKAWKLVLNPDACWEDGTPINADTYIYSYKELLDPVMKNRRADSLYAGDFVVYNAKNYFYAGQSAFGALSMTVADALASGISADDIYVDCWGFWGANGYIDAEGNACSQYVKITDETVYSADGAGSDAFSGASLYADYFIAGSPYESYGASYCGTIEAYASDVSWDDVGIIKTGDYELVYITVSPTADANYYVPYNLSSTYLVYEPLWEACKTYYNSNGDKVSKDSADIASISTNYCTTADTTMSYGPYKLTYFELDKQYTLERNDTWYGYKDGKHLGQYQTDKISVQVINKHETQLLAFLAGEVDGVSLQADDMAKYGSSDYVRYTPQSYTTKLTFNIDPASAASRGTQILTNANFRKGFSLAIDVNTFASSLTTGMPGYGMLNTLYVYDPFTGASYRSTDGAKKALVELYGLTYGAGGDYENLEDAYDAVTGYDLVGAREAMAKAYAEVKEEGLYNDEKVELEIRVYQSDDIYVKMFNFLKSALENACVGTGFEGKVTLKMTVDEDYYDTMYSGGTDIIFTTWGGAAYSPYTILAQCYCDASDGSGNQMEYGFDTSKIPVTIKVDGTDFTASLQKWANWAAGDVDTFITARNGAQLAAFNDYDPATKADFYGKLEYAYLSFFVTTPIYYRSVASMVSQKGDYAVKNYVDLVGFGGLAYFTYNYDDAAWDAYVKAGSLNY